MATMSPNQFIDETKKQVGKKNNFIANIISIQELQPKSPGCNPSSSASTP